MQKTLPANMQNSKLQVVVLLLKNWTAIILMQATQAEAFLWNSKAPLPQLLLLNAQAAT
jgi:hypothetical protein